MFYGCFEFDISVFRLLYTLMQSCRMTVSPQAILKTRVNDQILKYGVGNNLTLEVMSGAIMSIKFQILSKFAPKV